jgi:hypothetical protein
VQVLPRRRGYYVPGDVNANSPARGLRCVTSNDKAGWAAGPRRVHVNRCGCARFSIRCASCIACRPGRISSAQAVLPIVTINLNTQLVDQIPAPRSKSYTSSHPGPCNRPPSGSPRRVGLRVRCCSVERSQRPGQPFSAVPSRPDLEAWLKEAHKILRPGPAWNIFQVFFRFCHIGICKSFAGGARYHFCNHPRCLQVQICLTLPAVFATGTNTTLEYIRAAVDAPANPSNKRQPSRPVHTKLAHPVTFVTIKAPGRWAVFQAAARRNVHLHHRTPPPIRSPSPTSSTHNHSIDYRSTFVRATSSSFPRPGADIATADRVLCKRGGSRIGTMMVALSRNAVPDEEAPSSAAGPPCPLPPTMPRCVQLSCSQVLAKCGCGLLPP